MSNTLSGTCPAYVAHLQASAARYRGGCTLDPSISTGSLAVDRALGVGGVPRSRVTEIFGPEGGGKTTLAQHLVAEAQKLGGTAVYIDMEHAVDLAYMQACGVDTSAVYFSQRFPLWSS